jgi:hypothetical protein
MDFAGSFVSAFHELPVQSFFSVFFLESISPQEV